MRSERLRDPVAGPNTGPQAPFPMRISGKVIKGFGRGGSELDIPTANIPLSNLSVVAHDDVESGVYYGWASLSPSKATLQRSAGSEHKYKHIAAEVYERLNSILRGNDGEGGGIASATKGKGVVYPAVLSIGWNPFYKNTVRSLEVHVMHDFDEQFYDSQMKLVILGFIRPEYDYVSKESLIDDIKTDIDVAGRSLGRPAYAEFAKDPYLFNF